MALFSVAAVRKFYLIYVHATERSYYVPITISPTAKLLTPRQLSLSGLFLIREREKVEIQKL